MKDSADLTIRRSQAPRPRGAVADAAARKRFSPLNAPQRAAVESFCAESRTWALRQAARTYRHLPEELREQAVDAAMRELRTGAPVAVDRRTLYAELALELTAALRRVHIGWCLNQSTALFREDGIETPPAPPDGERLATFVNEGLGGLERAVLQLEIGAGRDTRTSRAALRLGPRQYARHREEGLSKLRDAITGTVAGHVCDDHVAHVVLAATGDKGAAEALAAGASRCRSCSREAQGLRRLLHERLALAPWPFVVKPVGILAAKAAAITAAIGGKGVAGGAAAGVGSSSVGSGAGVVATVLAAAAVATGGATLIKDDPPATTATKATAAQTAPAPTRAVTAAPATSRTQAAAKPAAAKHRTTKAARKHPKATQHHAAAKSAPQTTAAAPTATSAPTSTSAPATSGTPNPVKQTTDTVGKTVNDTGDKVQNTVDNVVKPVAPQLQQPVDQVVDQTQDTVDQLTNTVGNLLTPPK